jgi:hypothetical protein
MSQTIALCRFVSACAILTVLTARAQGPVPVEGIVATRGFSYQSPTPRGWQRVENGGVVHFLNLYLLPQGLLPRGGADIAVVPVLSFSGRLSEMTQEQWISWVVSGSPLQSRRVESIGNIGNPQASNIKKLSFESDLEGRDPEQYIAYFLKLRGQLFEISLHYNMGDSKRASFEKTLDNVARDIRVVGNR